MSVEIEPVLILKELHQGESRLSVAVTLGNPFENHKKTLNDYVERIKHIDTNVRDIQIVPAAENEKLAPVSQSYGITWTTSREWETFAELLVN